MASQHLAQPCVLVGNRCVTALPGLLPEVLKLLRQPLAVRLSLHHKATIPGPAAVMREPQEGESRATLLPAPFFSQAREPAELDQAGLLFVEREVELAHAVTKGLHHGTSIVGVLEAHHKVVGVAHDDHSTPCISPPPLMDPQVQNVVQKDVGQDRADTRTLGGSLFCRRPSPFFEHTGLKPQAYQPENPSVGDPMRHHPQEPPLVDRVERLSNMMP